MTEEATGDSIVRMDDLTRNRRNTRQFLIRLLQRYACEVQRYGPAEPAVLRTWAAELEALAEDEEDCAGSSLRGPPHRDA
jgi:hypothetical protein